MGAEREAFATACGITLQVWEATSSGPAFAAANLPQSAPVTAVTSGSGGVLFSGDAAGRIFLHHASAGVGSGSFSTAALDPSADGNGAGHQVNSLAVTTGPESARLAVGCKNGAVQLWSLMDRVSTRLPDLFPRKIAMLASEELPSIVS
jgi:WD40 repeat protein